MLKTGEGGRKLITLEDKKASLLFNIFFKLRIYLQLQLLVIVCLDLNDNDLVTQPSTCCMNYEEIILQK